MQNLLNLKTRQGKIISGLTALLALCCSCSLIGVLLAPSQPETVERAAPAGQIAVTPAALQSAEVEATAKPLPTDTPLSAPTDTPAPTAQIALTNDAVQPPTWQPTATPAPSADSQAALPTGLQEAQVINVVDGDTIDVLIDGIEYRVRYILIDTPETKHPERGVEPFGPEAYEFNKSLVDGQTVRLEKDVSETDRYGRLLRYVYVGDLMVNEELLRQGLATVATFPPDVKYVERFLAVQSEAQAVGVGIWSGEPAIEPTLAAEPIATPAVEPTVPPPATVAPTEPAPAGQPSGAGLVIVGLDKREEYVNIQNNGGAAVDLAGWRLLSEKGSQDCALGGVIQPGEVLRVWAMSEDAGQGGYNCGFGSNIWNNSERDPAVLIDPSGVEVSRIE